MSNQISFFTAVDYSLYLGEKTASKSLNHYVDDYFYLGGKKAFAIETDSGDKRTAVFENNDTETFIITALKVVSYMSIIIPIIMLGLKTALRHQHNYAYLQDNMTLPLFDNLKKDAEYTPPQYGWYPDPKSHINKLMHPIFMSNEGQVINQNFTIDLEIGSYFSRIGSSDILRHAHPYVRKDRDLALTAVTINGSELQFADDSFKKDKKFVLAALKNNTTRAERRLGMDLGRFSTLNTKPKQTTSLASKTAKIYKDIIDCIDYSLLNDKDFILENLKTLKTLLEMNKYIVEQKDVDNHIEIISYYLNNTLTYANNSLKEDASFHVETLDIITDILKLASEQLKEKYSYLAHDSRLGYTKLIEHVDEVRMNAYESLNKNMDFMLEALKESDKAIYYIDDSLRENKNFMIKAAQINPMAFFLIDNSAINLKSLVGFKYDDSCEMTPVTKEDFKNTKYINYDDCMLVVDHFVNNPELFSKNLLDLHDQFQSYNLPQDLLLNMESSKKSLLSPDIFLIGIKKKYDKETVSALLDVVKISFPIEYEAIVKEIDNYESEQRKAHYKTYKTNNLNFLFE